MNLNNARTIATRTLAGSTLVVLGLAAVAGSASAHVSTVESSVESGSYAVLTFSVPHGCEESPTTRVRIAIDPSIESVTPTVNPGWTLETVTEGGDSSGGHDDSAKTTEVIYTAKEPLPAHYRDAFELSIKTPEAPGTNLTFPVVQDCVEATTSWTQVAAEGQNPHELDYPAPVVAITEAAESGHGDDAAVEGDDVSTEATEETDEAEAADETEAAAATTAADDDEAVSGIVVVTFILAVTGVIGAGIALIIALRKQPA